MTICLHRHSIQHRVVLLAVHRTAPYHRVHLFNKTPSAIAVAKSVLSSHRIDNRIEGTFINNKQTQQIFFFLSFHFDKSADEKTIKAMWWQNMEYGVRNNSQ